VSHGPTLAGLAILSTSSLVALAVAQRREVRGDSAECHFGSDLVSAVLPEPEGLFTSSRVDARFILPAILLCAFSVRIKVPGRAVVIALCVRVIVCGLRVGGIGIRVAAAR
jgi:hypothetical protein